MNKTLLEIDIEKDLNKSIKELTEDINKVSVEWDKDIHASGELALPFIIAKTNFYLLVKSSIISIQLSRKLEKLTFWLTIFTFFIFVLTIVMVVLK